MLVKQDGDLGRTNLHSCFLNYGNMSALVKNKILFFFQILINQKPKIWLSNIIDFSQCPTLMSFTDISKELLGRFVAYSEVPLPLL